MISTPPPAWRAIRHYLKLAGRTLRPEAPLFVAHDDRGGGQVLRDYYGVPAPEEEAPLSGEAIAQALRRYAEQAGLEPAAVTLHSLRHLGAELFQRASGDLSETQAFLDHAQLNTTQIYLRQISGEEHLHWEAMAEELGV